MVAPSLKPVPGVYDARQELDLRPHWTAIRTPAKPGKGAARKAAAHLAVIASKRTPTRPVAIPGGTPLAPLKGKAAPFGQALAKRSERRFGRPLTVTQIGRLVGQTTGGVVLSCLLDGSALEEGLNTLVVAVVLPGGGRLEASCTFFGETVATPPSRPKPTDLVPQKIADKFVLPPKKDRLQSIAAQKKAIEQRGLAKRKALRDGLGVTLAPHLKPGKR